MRGTFTKLKVGVQTVIRNERGSYIPLPTVALPNHQDAAMLPVLAAFGDKDCGPSVVSRYDMLVQSDLSINANSFIF